MKLGIARIYMKFLFVSSHIRLHTFECNATCLGFSQFCCFPYICWCFEGCLDIAIRQGHLTLYRIVTLRKSLSYIFLFSSLVIGLGEHLNSYEDFPIICNGHFCFNMLCEKDCCLAVNL